MVRTRTKKTTRAGNRESRQGRSELAVPLSELADKGLAEENATALIRMAEKANQGDVHSRCRLFELSKPISTGDETGANGPGFSQALLWEQEPEWQGESSEAMAETASGSREPENPLN